MNTYSRVLTRKEGTAHEYDHSDLINVQICKVYGSHRFGSTHLTLIFSISETWLNKSVSDSDHHIAGCNVYCTDRPKKGGGVAIYVKT